MVELNKERKQHKIEYHTTNMFPKAADAPTKETWIAEMSEGIGSLQKDKDNNELAEGECSEIQDEENSKINKPKTRKQRRKELKLKVTEKRAIYGKKEKMKVQEVYRIKSMNKEIIAEEKTIAERMAKRAEQKEMKKSLPADITGHKFEEQDMDLKVINYIKLWGCTVPNLWGGGWTIVHIYFNLK